MSRFDIVGLELLSEFPIQLQDDNSLLAKYQTSGEFYPLRLDV